MPSYPTILVTGCSSGFGLETCRLFLERGWRVVATMRSPRTNLLPPSERLAILPLDVTDAASIARCIAAAGEVDVLVNNAGIGLLGPLEGVPEPRMRELFETNVFGTVAMTQALLPQMRARRSGVIVNVGSAVTLQALPLLSVYTATKAAVDGLTRSLALELAPLGIRAHLVLPGRAPGTSFGASARQRMNGGAHEAYAEFTRQVFAARPDDAAPATRAADVAQAIWHAVTDDAAPQVLAAGADAQALMKTPEVSHSERLIHAGAMSVPSPAP